MLAYVHMYTHSHSIISNIIHIITGFYTPSLPSTHHHCLLHTITAFYTPSLPSTHHHCLLHTITAFYTPSLPSTHHHWLLHTITAFTTPSLPSPHHHWLQHTITAFDLTAFDQYEHSLVLFLLDSPDPTADPTANLRPLPGISVSVSWYQYYLNNHQSFLQV